MIAQRSVVVLALTILAVVRLAMEPAVAAMQCPPAEEHSLADKHCPRSMHRTQLALDECYMQIALDFAMDVLSRHSIEVHLSHHALLTAVRYSIQ